MTNLDSVLKSKRHHFADKSPYSQGYGLSSSHIRLWELNHIEGRVLKNWYLQTVVLEKTLESPLDSNKIKPVNFQGNQPWILSLEGDWCWSWSSTIWSPDANSQLTGKDPDAGKDWEQKKRMSEDEMARWHHWCNGHEFVQTPGDGEGRETWHAAVHEVVKSRTQLRNWTTSNWQTSHTTSNWQTRIWPRAD